MRAMRICGLKLTHDGAVAVIEDGRLLFCVEMEKRKNGKRFAEIGDTVLIAEILNEAGCDPHSIDTFVVDGWGGYDLDALAVQPRLEIGESHNSLAAEHRGTPYRLDVAQYRERDLRRNVLEEFSFEGLRVAERPLPYSSFLHVAGHLAGAYCTSPAAARGEDAYLLAWDGGMYPRLYFFHAATRKIDNLGPIFLLVGNLYTIFSQHFGPFKVAGTFAKDELSIAGKVMAYIALGQARRELFPLFHEIYRQSYDAPMGFANTFANEFKRRTAGQNLSDADVLHSFHLFLQELLIEKLKKGIERHGKRTGNLVLTGGCALNIKWNSAIRRSGLCEELHIPPFPNDSGSALGMACCGMLRHTEHLALEWTPYDGPTLRPSTAEEGWRARAVDLVELAEVLHTRGDPIVVLHGRAELGPRALGNRSILAPAVEPRMRQVLNEIKLREGYRPISPICLESEAAAIFNPGTPDPYMLFDHRVRPEWVEKIPGVLHLDGTARLQTVNREQNPVIYQLLTSYQALSGIPLLCNTSANLKGHGFFPDAASAMRWGGVDLVWSEGILYERRRSEPSESHLG
jgi:carbamoyltransferase